MLNTTFSPGTSIIPYPYPLTEGGSSVKKCTLQHSVNGRAIPSTTLSIVFM
jgi:hypothetical protein